MALEYRRHQEGIIGATLSPLTGDAAYDILASVGDTAYITDDGLVTGTPVDATYVTLTDTSGAGVVTNIVLPGVTAGSNTVSVKITLDGVIHELTFTMDNATDRVVAGAVVNTPGDQNSGNKNLHTIWDGATFMSGLAFRHTDTAFKAIMLDPSYQVANAPCLRFDSSLKVEMKSSTASATNNREECAVVYVLDQ